MVSLNEDGYNKAYHQNIDSHQQVFFVYDPLVCTKVKEDGAYSDVRAFGCTRVGLTDQTIHPDLA